MFENFVQQTFMVVIVPFSYSQANDLFMESPYTTRSHCSHLEGIVENEYFEPCKRWPQNNLSTERGARDNH